MMDSTHNHYGFGAPLDLPYEQALAQIKEALKGEGFGVLTEIDVRETMRAKLGVEMPPYMILGACNPPLAHRALTTEPEIGLMLPCNVVVRAEGERTRMDIADPEAMLGIGGSDNPELRAVAAEAKQRLHRVLAALTASQQATRTGQAS